MKMRSTVPVQVAKTGYIMLSLFFCAVGSMLILHPNFSVQLLGKIIGIGMLVFGAIKIIGYLSKDLFRLAFQFDLEFGVLLIVLGLILLLHPIDVMTFLFISVGNTIMADALFKIRIAREAHQFGIRQWRMVLTLAIASGIVGLALILRPWQNLIALTVLLGVALCAQGLLNICVALSMVKIIGHQYPDVIDTEWEEI